MASSIPLMNDGNVVDDISVSKIGREDAKLNVGRLGDSSAVLHRSLHQDPLHVVSAKGHYLYISNGQMIFDATGGAAVACLGHGDER
jgi:4-aminobutyrate aminotransferase-like enzyme